MALVLGQVITGNGTAVSIVTVPAGSNTVMITNAGTATIYLGNGTASSTNGYPLLTTQSVILPGFVGSRQSTTIYAISASGSSIAVGYMISNAQ